MVLLKPRKERVMHTSSTFIPLMRQMKRQLGFAWLPVPIKKRNNTRKEHEQLKKQRTDEG
jgi:hypothetical protein